MKSLYAHPTLWLFLFHRLGLTQLLCLKNRNFETSATLAQLYLRNKISFPTLINNSKCSHLRKMIPVIMFPDRIPKLFFCFHSFHQEKENDKKREKEKVLKFQDTFYNMLREKSRKTSYRFSFLFFFITSNLNECFSSLFSQPFIPFKVLWAFLLLRWLVFKLSFSFKNYFILLQKNF